MIGTGTTPRAVSRAPSCPKLNAPEQQVFHLSNKKFHFLPATLSCCRYTPSPRSQYRYPFARWFTIPTFMCADGACISTAQLVSLYTADRASEGQSGCVLAVDGAPDGATVAYMPPRVPWWRSERSTLGATLARTVPLRDISRPLCSYSG